MVIIIISACNKKNIKEMPLKFSLYYQNQVLDCQKLKTLPVELNELRFYLHDLQLNNQSLQLTQNDKQHQSVVYLDFSSTARHCASNVDLEPNQEVVFQVGDVGAGNLSFKLGVPLVLNHQNPVKAKSPLNRSDMHWQWLSGYKFLRLEYLNKNELNRLHLGSTACSGRVPDNVTCKNPNRLEIDLAGFDIRTSVIEVHIDELLKPQNGSLCMGDFEQEDCRFWLNTLQNNVFKVANKE